MEQRSSTNNDDTITSWNNKSSCCPAQFGITILGGLDQVENYYLFIFWLRTWDIARDESNVGDDKVRASNDRREPPPPARQGEMRERTKQQWRSRCFILTARLKDDGSKVVHHPPPFSIATNTRESRSRRSKRKITSQKSSLSSSSRYNQ